MGVVAIHPKSEFSFFLRKYIPLYLILLQVPLGKGTKDATKKTDLLYSEYIVYDVSQVQMRLQGVYKPRSFVC